jgi:O-antigen/teichoic acid export membrane protein
MSIIRRQTILGTVFSYAGVLIGTFTQAFLYANYLEIEVVGLFAMLFNWNMILGYIMNLGFNNAGTKYFNVFRDEKRKHNGYLFNGLFYLLIGAILVFIILHFFKDLILNSSVSDNNLFSEYYYLIFPLSFASGLFYVFENYTKGLYDTLMSNFLLQFLQRVLVLIVVLLFIMNVVNFDSMMNLWLVALSTPAVFMIWYSVNLGGFSIRPSGFLMNSPFKKEFITFSGFSVITGLSTVIITKLDSLLVYEYLGLKQIGIYNFCLLFGSVMTISYNVAMKASSAIVLDAVSQNDYKKVGVIFKKSSITQVVFGTLLLLIVWVNIDSLFSFIRPEYAAGKYIILIIGISKLFDLSSGINSLILAYSEYYKLDAFIIVTFIGLLLLLNHLLIPIYGLNGAAMSALVATVYYNLTRNFLIWRFFKIQPYQWAILYVVCIGSILGVLGELLPNLGQSNLSVLLSIAYKTISLSLFFIASLYFLNVSEDMNGILKKGYKNVAKRLWLS